MSDRMATFRILVAAAFLVLVARAAPSAAAEEGIVVHSSGSASARPTCVEMSAQLSAEAELAADAAVKFRDAKKRALAAMTALKNAKLTVTPGGVTVATGMDSRTQRMMAMQGYGTDTSGQKVRITETCRIVLADADKLEADDLLGGLLKVLDSAKDAGFTFTMPVTNDYYEMQARRKKGKSSFSSSFPTPQSCARSRTRRRLTMRRPGHKTWPSCRRSSSAGSYPYKKVLAAASRTLSTITGRIWGAGRTTRSRRSRRRGDDARESHGAVRDPQVRLVSGEWLIGEW